MKSRKTQRGFVVVEHPSYANDPDPDARLIQESSATDLKRRPGGTFLWIGEHHHLNRREVWELIRRMVRWLITGRLAHDA